MTAPKSDAPPLTVWLVEDYAPFRNTVSRLLNGTDGMACPHIFATAEDALRSLKSQTKPRAILVDVGLPGMNGIETLIRIREIYPMLPVIMLTGLNDAETAVQALRAGADDYLTKPFAMEELLARVEVLGRRNVAPETEIVFRVGDLCMDMSKRKVSRGGVKVDLSPREFEVLHVFMREPGRAFSRDEICERIWEREHEYDTRTVEIFIMRLRKKLDRPNEESVIRTIRSVGYMMSPTP